MTRVGLTQRVSVVEGYGERRDCLDQEWTVLLEGLGYTPVLLPNSIEAVGEYLDALALDAVVLTSGNDLLSVDDPTEPAPERDRFEDAVVEYAIDEGLPILGVCRGLELLNTYFGGTLTDVPDHAACTHTVELRDESEELDLPDRVEVNSYHDYGIERSDVGDDLVVLGTAFDDTVEWVTHESLPIWGMMWHPERESPSTSIDLRIIDRVLDGGES